MDSGRKLARLRQPSRNLHLGAKVPPLRSAELVGLLPCLLEAHLLLAYLLFHLILVEFFLLSINSDCFEDRFVTLLQVYAALVIGLQVLRLAPPVMRE